MSMKNKSNPFRRSALLASAIVFTFGQAAHAASATWNGTTDAVWATATNWSANPVPGTGDTATFDNAGLGRVVINLGTGVTVQNLMFNTSLAAAYTIGSGAVNSQKLTLDNGGAITLNSTVTKNQLFNSTVTLGTDGSTQGFTLTNQTATTTLTLAGAISGSTGAGVKTLTVAGTGATTLSGIVSNGTAGSVALAKTGAGSLTLTGVNTFTGGVTLGASAGTVLADFSSTKNSLGTGPAVIGTGSTLQVNNLTTTNVTNNIATVFTGTGWLKLNFAAGATARNTSMANLTGFTGTIQLSTAGATGDKWNMNSGLSTSAPLIIDSGSQLYINTAAATFTNGITFTGTGNNENRGAVRLGAIALGGNLTLAGDATIGTEGGTITGNITNGTTVLRTLTFGGAGNGNATVSGVIGGGLGILAVTKAATGTVTLTGTNTYTGETKVTAGVLVLAKSDTLNQYNNVVVSGGATLAVMTGDGTTGWSAAQIDALSVAGVTPLTTDARIGFDTTLGNFTYGSLIDGPYALNKVGVNSLTLTAANTYAGATYASGGTLIAADPGAFGAAGKTISWAGGTVDFATDTPVNIYLGNLGTGATGTVLVNRATPGAAITHTLGVSTFGNGTLNVQAGANVTSGNPVLAITGINLNAGAAGTLTLNPTTADLAITGPVNIAANNFAKTLGLGGTSTGNVVSGVISDGVTASKVSVTKSNTGTWTLTGANTYTGTTTVAGGTLILDYSVEDNSKLSDTGPLALAGGTLSLSVGTVPEIVGATSLTANTASFVTASPGAPVLHLNTITRNTGAKVNFSADGIATTDNLNTNGILGAWATVGGTDWATNSTNSDDGPITTFTDYTLSSLAGDAAANYLDKNISVDSSQTLDLAATPNSLRFSTAGANTLTLTGVNTITAGGILVTSAVGANPTLITGGSLSGASGGDLVITQNNLAGNLTIASVIENNGTTNVVKFGPGTAILSGDNTYTGTTTVSGGTLTLSGAKSGTCGTITVANISGLDATLNIENGIYALGTNRFSVTNSATTPVVGTVNQSGGTVSFAGDGDGMLLGNSGTTTIPNTANYNLSGGSLTTGSTKANRGIILGTHSNTISTFTLSGAGTLNMNAATGGTGTSVLEVGRFDSAANTSTSVFNQTGGTANVAILSVGGNGGTGIGLSSTMNLTGGVFVADTFPRLALGNTNIAEINISGTADVTLPAIPAGRGIGSTATVNFDGGTLRSRGASATYLNAPTNAIIKAGGANFNIATGRDIAIAQALLPHATSTGGGLTKAGPGKLALTGTNTYTGMTTITEGALSIGTPPALPGWDTAGKYSVAAGATLGVYNAITETEIATLLATGNFAAGALLGFDTTSGDRIYAGNLGDTTVGALGLEKLGANMLTLTGPNSYTGLTSVESGELRITHAGAIGGTAAIINATGRLSLEAGLTMGAGKTVTLNGDGGNFFGALQSFSGASEWQGNVTLGTALSRIGANAGGIGTGSLKVSGVIDSGALVTGLLIRSNTGGTVELSGANTYLGDTIVGFGTLKLSGGSNRLPITTKLLMGITTISGLLDLNGQNQEVAGLSMNQATAPFTNEITATAPATLTVNTAALAPSTYSGKLTGSLTLLKLGDDTLTLTGVNSYTGNTRVEAGILSITAPAFADNSTVTIGTVLDSPAKLDLPTAGTDVVAGLVIDGVAQPVGVYDAANTNGAITGLGKIEVLITKTPFESWAETTITAISPGADATPGGDPDRDGRSNLAEFAFDGNPLSGANDGKIVGKIAAVAGSNVLTLTLPVRTGATFTGAAALVSAVIDGITYTIEGSDNLVTWPLDIDEVTGADADALKATMPPLSSGAWTYRSFRTPDAVTADPSDFIRAKAE
jgi:autotransporter-associated beta strand protein